VGTGLVVLREHSATLCDLRLVVAPGALTV